MAIIHSTLLNHGSTSLYLTLHYSTLDVLDSTLLPWLYLTLLDSTLLYHGSTLHYFIVALLYST